MNERIEQLAIEAFFDDSTNTDGQKMYIFGEKKMQLFAELIVKECIIQCQREIFTNGRYTDHNIAIHSCMDSIKDHFGVDK